MGNKEMVEFELEQIRETDAAYLLADGACEVWIPKSQIEEEETMPNGLLRIVIPEWLANAKELI